MSDESVLKLDRGPLRAATVVSFRRSLSAAHLFRDADVGPGPDLCLGRAQLLFPTLVPRETFAPSSCSGQNDNIFVGTSNEFGALESGLTAAIFGPVVSVLAGGVGTILVVRAVATKWPETRKIGALDESLA
ncbi:MAG: hypothetical protein H0V54_07595 [Chthoniobacterales bacterium]|nr:hypothetical protein [Chthoniobacterales bacterium]